MVVAAATRRLAAMLKYHDPEEAYTAGLLHDIGKLLLDKYVEPYYRGMAAEVDRGRSIIEVEEQFVGTDHATIGGLIAELWSLPKSLQEAIRFHHVPSLSTKPKLAALVSFANILVLQSGIGLTPLGVPALLPEITKFIAVKDDDLGVVAYALRPEIQSADAQFQSGAKADSSPLTPQGSGLLARTQALRSKH
jgi:putative nucleotidyltransferase with HDIG domain